MVNWLLVTIVVVIVDVISRITIVLNMPNIKIIIIERVIIIRFLFEIWFLPIEIRLIII